jgi:hypothetical protein
MTTHQTEAHDPMTYREPPLRGVSPVSSIETMSCGRRACEGRLDVTHVATDKRASFAEIHGYLREDGKLFCSKRCVALHKMTPDGGTSGLIAKPMRIEALRIPTRATVRSVTDRHDVTTHWLVCDRMACTTKVESPSIVPEIAAKAAAAHGFVEVSYGTFCSASCVTQARLDIEGGLQSLPRGDVLAPLVAAVKPLPVHDTEGVRAPEAVGLIADVTYQERRAEAKSAGTPEEEQVQTENRKARRERERLAAALAK